MIFGVASGATSMGPVALGAHYCHHKAKHAAAGWKGNGTPVGGSDGSSAPPQRIPQRLRRSIGSWRTAAGAIIEKLPFNSAILYVSLIRQRTPQTG